jgi:hypothetical protein
MPTLKVLITLIAAVGAVEQAGFIDISASRPQTAGSSLFYWFTPSQTSEPSKAPLIIWLQGAPLSPSTYYSCG